jgi:hypothetical protein
MQVDILSAPLLITWVMASFAFCQGAMFQTCISWFLDLSWPVYLYDMFSVEQTLVGLQFCVFSDSWMVL